jgi:cyclopropane-fatty-acyl-phospholipid synthase
MSVDSWARRIVLSMLGRISVGHLTVIDTDGSVHRGGPAGAAMAATVQIRDERCWRALLFEGAIGYGRGFIEGWWHTDDPTTVTRIVISNLSTIDDLRARWAQVWRVPRDAYARIRPRAGRVRNREDIAAHYDIGNDFFATFLDETMTYSCAVFDERDDELADASVRKYQRLLDKLDVRQGHRVLEIGSGWGGFATYATRTTGCEVTTTTVSGAQHGAVLERARRHGVADRVVALEHDWRDLTALGRRFDRVVSIEMIEAVDWRDYRRFFATIEGCMTTDGAAGLQAILIPDRRFQASKYSEDFIRRFVFPGGMLPSLGAIVDAACNAGRLQLFDLEDISRHYAETLHRWRDRFEARIDDVHALGLDDRFCRLWRMYLAYCEAAFTERHINVAQLVFVGPQWRGDLSLRAA